MEPSTSSALIDSEAFQPSEKEQSTALPTAQRRINRAARRLAYAAALGIACLALWLADPAVYRAFSLTPLLEFPQTPLSSGNYTRTVVQYTCSNTACEAWLYLPHSSDAAGSRPPVVVMGPGLGSQRTQLEETASAMAGSGLAVLLFDYRTYGGSLGVPRHWTDPRRDQQDWLSGVAYIRTALSDAVDARQLVLYGASMSGGHALAVAARLGADVSAVVAVTSHLDSPGLMAMLAYYTAVRGPIHTARLLGASLCDSILALFGAQPAYIRLVGSKQELAMFQLAPAELDSHFGYGDKADLVVGGWRNRVTARTLLRIPFYRPIRRLSKVQAPTFLVSGLRDVLTPPATIWRAAKRLRAPVRLLELEGGHNATIAAMAEPQNVGAVLEFLHEHVRF